MIASRARTLITVGRLGDPTDTSGELHLVIIQSSYTVIIPRHITTAGQGNLKLYDTHKKHTFISASPPRDIGYKS